MKKEIRAAAVFSAVALSCAAAAVALAAPGFGPAPGDQPLNVSENQAENEAIAKILNIRDEQKAAWDEYNAAREEVIQAREKRFEAGPADRPENLQSRIEQAAADATARAEQFSRVAGARAKLLEVLDDQQKLTLEFVELHGPQGGRGDAGRQAPRGTPGGTPGFAPEPARGHRGDAYVGHRHHGAYGPGCGQFRQPEPAPQFEPAPRPSPEGFAPDGQRRPGCGCPGGDSGQWQGPRQFGPGCMPFAGYRFRQPCLQQGSGFASPECPDFQQGCLPRQQQRLDCRGRGLPPGMAPRGYGPRAGFAPQAGQQARPAAPVPQPGPGMKDDAPAPQQPQGPEFAGRP